MSIGNRPTAYAPRTLVALPGEMARGWHIKRYGISATRPRPPDGVIEAARLAVERSLPEPFGDALSCAFSVLHEDSDGCYVVVAWWSRNRLILHTRTWLSEWADPAAWEPAPGAATACIWELVAIGHERDAWTEHVVTPPSPDLAGYLASSTAGRF